jgi:hypothetical protein
MLVHGVPSRKRSLRHSTCLEELKKMAFRHDQPKQASDESTLFASLASHAEGASPILPSKTHRNGNVVIVPRSSLDRGSVLRGAPAENLSINVWLRCCRRRGRVDRLLFLIMACPFILLLVWPFAFAPLPTYADRHITFSDWQMLLIRAAFVPKQCCYSVVMVSPSTVNSMNPMD